MTRVRAGLGFGLTAYFIWGAFPFYFGLLAAVHPLEVVPWRVASSLIFCAVVVTLLRDWRSVAAVFRKPRTFGWFSLSSILLYVNWQTFVLAVLTGHVIEAALGYFINPLITILIGVVVRHERLRRLQWLAVGIAAVGVIAAATAYGAFPWFAMTIAVSFGFYGALHKHSGEHVSGIAGLTIETIVAAPVAVIQLAVVHMVLGLTGLSHDSWVTTLLIFSGIVTAVPLILFGEAARRLPLTYLGFIQFLTPILGFIYGVVFTDETMSLGRWLGFTGVWIALVLLMIDMIIQLRTKPEREIVPLTGPVPLD